MTKSGQRQKRRKRPAPLTKIMKGSKEEWDGPPAGCPRSSSKQTSKGAGPGRLAMGGFKGGLGGSWPNLRFGLKSFIFSIFIFDLIY